MIRDLIRWGFANDPYAPVILIALPAFVAAVGILFLGLQA